MKINIESLTSKNIKAGQFKNDLPEIYDLKEVVEDNGWHKKQDVFTHTLAALKQLEIILDLKTFSSQKKDFLKKHLKEKIGNYTRKDLLIVSTLLHDIAKPITAMKDKTGIVRCPGHEFFGSVMVESFSSRLGLSKKDEEYVKRMVFYHGFIVEVLNQIMSKENKNYYLNSYKKAVGDIYYDLLLLFYSDLLGSNLKELNPKEYKIRKNLILDFLQSNS
ncbi:HD domain-containing protein [Patescibacteria group bacterium]|nr:HD domain-containing protein [Patescibacteria group bacterium]MBU2035840.1 HD domain-containing protein [Patescibacteria group bacterium]